MTPDLDCQPASSVATTFTHHIVQFRTELAPSLYETLALPEATADATYTITPAGAIVAVSRNDDPEYKSRRYHEAYLQLFDVDLEDIRSIVKFLNNNGPLSITSEDHLGFDWHSGFREVRRFVEDESREIGLEIADWDRMAGWSKHYSLVQSLSQFLWQATCIRDLIRAWRWYREDVAVLPDEWESPVWAYPDERFPCPSSPDEAAELLRQGIRSGLRPFHPELRIRAFDDDDRWSSDYGGSIAFYSICCLELFNLIVRDSELSRCQNQRCGRLFGLQEGRSQKGRHRSVGVKYCSLSCARAQAQRDYRHRKTRSRNEV